MIRHVLDHGFVRLVSFMQPANSEIGPDGMRRDEWSGDLEVVRNARVSYDGDWRTGQDEGSDTKLINSMTTRRHTSPFEAMVFTFEVKAPIFVLRQWHRHRTWSYNELSARYAPMQEEFYVPDPYLVGNQHLTDKQMRTIEEQDPDLKIYERNQAWAVDMVKANQAAFGLYRRLLDGGMPRELARTVLPVSTYSRMFATVDLHNLKGFLTLRQDAHAQYEIRVYADAIFDLVETVCPLSMSAFNAQRNGGS